MGSPQLHLALELPTTRSVALRRCLTPHLYPPPPPPPPSPNPSFPAFNQKGRGESLIADGDKCMKRFSLFGPGTKYEEAAEFYSKAGNCFKVSNLWQEAGDAYMKAADVLQKHVKSQHEASAALMDAGNCYKRVSPPDAIGAFRGAISNYCEAGRFNQAAKLQKEIAEMYEGDSNAPEAIENFVQAATFFETEKSKSMANQCMAKVAELCSSVLQPPDYARAAKVYEDLGKGCLDSPLVKYNAKNHFLAAIFCKLAQGDAVAARQKFDQYVGLDFSFRDAREGTLCNSLIEAFDATDPDAFATACAEFDRVNKLDGWRITTLAAIKRGLEEQAGGGGGDGDVDLT